MTGSDGGREISAVRVSFVVAMSRSGLIGREGGLPWRLPRDLKHFRGLTWGKPIIMGRKTHESIGRPLPGRTNIVLTRRADYEAEGCRVAGSVAEALDQARSTGAEEAMVIGGAEVYRALLSHCETMYLTLVEGDFEGDVFFPGKPLDSPDWRIAHEESWPADEANPHDARYAVLERARD